MLKWAARLAIPARLNEGEQCTVSSDRLQAPYKGVIAHIGQTWKRAHCTWEMPITRRYRHRTGAKRSPTTTRRPTSCIGPCIMCSENMLNKPDRSSIRTACALTSATIKPLTHDEINQIEDLVNAKIRENLPVKLV